MASNIIYIAMQNSGTVANTFKTWNEDTSQQNTTEIINLLDEDGNATVFDWEQNGDNCGQATNGVNAVGTGDAAWCDEAIITQHRCDVATNVPQYRFFGLDNAKTYDFELFGSRDASGPRRLQISVDAFSSVEDEIDCAGNSTATAKALGVSPISNAIIIHWRKNPSDGFAYVSAVKMTENIVATGGHKGVFGSPLHGPFGGPI